MRTAGETRPFIERRWDELAAQWTEAAQRGIPVAYVLAIIESVRASSAVTQLAAASSMYDLIVSARPVPEPPYTVVVVRSPVSIHPPAAGNVVIEHRSLTGRFERIERPVADAVPLFWRFMLEKFGVPGRP